jgi:hypothetical protein
MRSTMLFVAALAGCAKPPAAPIRPAPPPVAVAVAVAVKPAAVKPAARPVPHAAPLAIAPLRDTATPE